MEIDRGVLRGVDQRVYVLKEVRKLGGVAYFKIKAMVFVGDLLFFVIAVVFLGFDRFVIIADMASCFFFGIMLITCARSGFAFARVSKMALCSRLPLKSSGSRRFRI